MALFNELVFDLITENNKMKFLKYAFNLLEAELTQSRQEVGAYDSEGKHQV